MQPPETSSRAERLAPAAVALLCLLPFLIFWNRFAALYWFDDDWDMLHELQAMGLARWMQQPFGENFVPLFKAFWAAAIPLVDGSYFWMLSLSWMTHLGILLLFAALLRRFGLPLQAQCLAVLTLGMPWSNIEALAWATQWSSLLATFFLTLAFVLLLAAESANTSPRNVLLVGAVRARLQPCRENPGTTGASAPEVGSNRSTLFSALAALSALASALCFPRGVLTGAILGLFLLLSLPEDSAGRRWRITMAVVLIAITCLAVLPYRWMIHDYQKFQGLDAAKLRVMASFAAHHYLMNPLYQILPIPRKAVNSEALLIAGSCKALVIGAALVVANARQRKLLWTLLLLDAGTAVLLCLGRYDLGMAAAVVSRYQHASLLCFAPFFAIAVTKGLSLLKPMANR
ncbi:MAG: hypothetical protein HY648_11630, partial [Acidobacteria bacterium]|nr:hypothetical protein [Acidobacteriota bacterium]